MTPAQPLSPLHDRFTSDEAYFLPYGDESCVTQVVETFGDLDMEYAALRKGCVVFDQPHTGTIRVTGDERNAFLNNMLTAKLDDLAPGAGARSFWLNRKGRIDADLRVAQREGDMIIACDRHIAAPTAAALAQFVFAEDVEIADASDAHHRLSIHGPTASRLLAAACPDHARAIESLGHLGNTTAAINGTEVLIEREDLTGETGLHLCMPTEHAGAVYDALIAAAQANPDLKARQAGWMALNAARIEAGTPLFNLDFGPTNLPAESGVVEDRVHFAKGCYLGQEVVARMHARGACARRVVALRIEDQRITAADTEIAQPTTGSQVFEVGKEAETPVGIVTSSTISPMLGAIPICLAMIKAGPNEPGTELSVSAEGKLVRAIVQDKLAFWSRANA